MGADQLFPGELVDGRRQSLRQAAGVDEDDRRAVFADQLEDAGMDRRPNTSPRNLLVICPPPIGERAGVGGFTFEVRHVVDRNFDGDLHRLDATSVDDRDLAIGAAEKACRFAEGTLGRREPNALRLGLRDG